MTDDEYFERLGYVKQVLHLHVFSGDDPFEHLAQNWLDDVAHEKHADYGIECWERLGPRALMADLSACYYRFKRLRAAGKNRKYMTMFDAIQDCFGYAMIYTVLVWRDFPVDVMVQALAVQLHGGFLHLPAGEVNELLIGQIWLPQSPPYRTFCLDVFSLSARMWEEAA